jgi:small-conductance mechanosensitive channel
VISLALIAVALVAAQLLYNLIVRAVARTLRGRGDFVRSLIVRTRGPGRLALLIAAVSWAVQAAPVKDGAAAVIQHGLLVAFICLWGWVLLAAADIGTALYMRRYRVDVADNLQARKHLTQVRILRRALAMLVVLLTVGIALMTIPGVRRIGVSLLAAGGAAGIILGLALQPLLSNLIAGVQIALTQPIRIDDAVVVADEFGHVEEVQATYVVIRLWDLRRLVVPLKYFLDQPIQNWTRESADLIGVVALVLDQRTPVDRLRQELEAIVRASPKWDGKLVKVRVTDIREKSMEVRCVVSAFGDENLFDLRAEVREKILAWLQRELPDALPRNGVEFSPEAAAMAGLGARPRPGDQRVQ